MKQVPIGIIDSGLGGYSVYRQLKQAYPGSSWLFLADQVHAPYGDKSKEEIIDIMIHNVSWMKSLGIKEVLLACNTASSNALEELRMTFEDMVFYGIIEVTVTQSAGFSRIGVLATEATVRSHAYSKAIFALNAGATVLEVSAKHLVAMIEEMADEATIKDYLLTLDPRLATMDALILGCTHYPIKKSLIEEILGVCTLDSHQPIIELFKDRQLIQGKSWVLTTKNPEYLANQIHRLFQEEVHVDDFKEVQDIEIGHRQ